MKLSRRTRVGLLAAAVLPAVAILSVGSPSASAAKAATPLAKPAAVKTVHASDTWTYTTNHWVKDDSRSGDDCWDNAASYNGVTNPILDDGTCNVGYRLGHDETTGYYCLETQSLTPNHWISDGSSTDTLTATAGGCGPAELFTFICEGGGSHDAFIDWANLTPGYVGTWAYPLVGMENGFADFIDVSSVC